ncbi:Hypothetical protein (Fragment) [Durusdinium trenchii]|uniref:Uncharacterized protein n=1 Tax=Durusdinium trenchii TaxID=1381693 RepID=A0ABP0LQJ0_9DINO
MTIRAAPQGPAVLHRREVGFRIAHRDLSEVGDIHARDEDCHGLAELSLGGESVDVYRLQTDDFDEPETLEVFYNDGRGGTLREIVFVDPIYADRRPRICVSIDGIQAMHKTISTLTRKVDNLVDTLQRCRGAYYKELSMLREQLYQQALAYRDGRGVQSQAATLFDPSAYISQTESEVEMQVSAVPRFRRRNPQGARTRFWLGGLVDLTRELAEVCLHRRRDS